MANEFLSDTVDGSEILQRLIGSLSHYLGKFYTSQVVQDFWTINSFSTTANFPTVASVPWPWPAKKLPNFSFGVGKKKSTRKSMEFPGDI